MMMMPGTNTYRTNTYRYSFRRYSVRTPLSASWWFSPSSSSSSLQYASFLWEETFSGARLGTGAPLKSYNDSYHFHHHHHLDHHHQFHHSFHHGLYHHHHHQSHDTCQWLESVTDNSGSGWQLAAIPDHAQALPYQVFCSKPIYAKPTQLALLYQSLPCQVFCTGLLYHASYSRYYSTSSCQDLLHKAFHTRPLPPTPSP